MPYVHRLPNAAIDSLHGQPDAGADEFLPDQHACVRAFVLRSGDDDGCSTLYADFVRVLEDLTDTLIVKNTLNTTDLPAPRRRPSCSRARASASVSRKARCTCLRHRAPVA